MATATRTQNSYDRAGSRGVETGRTRITVGRFRGLLNEAKLTPLCLMAARLVTRTGNPASSFPIKSPPASRLPLVATRDRAPNRGDACQAAIMSRPVGVARKRRRGQSYSWRLNSSDPFSARFPPVFLPCSPVLRKTGYGYVAFVCRGCV